MSVQPIFHTCRPLILASGSPRRRRFFAELGLQFAVESAEIDETPLAGEGAETFVRRLALAKAMAVARQQPGHVVVGADTAVVRDDTILGKPRDRRQASDMLASLAGRWHEVWTGFAVCAAEPALEQVGAVLTRVRFGELSPALIAAYLATGDGDDKAGAYGIQSGAAFMVAEIAGSYSNVIGLPMAELVNALQEHGIIAVPA